MPCDSRIPLGMTPPQRRKQIAQTIDALNKALIDKSVTVKIGANGAVAFVGWGQRNSVTDVCAYRKLLASGSPGLRAALVIAERAAGRKVDPQAVAAGYHSHDDGKTFSKH